MTRPKTQLGRCVFCTYRAQRPKTHPWPPAALFALSRPSLGQARFSSQGGPRADNFERSGPRSRPRLVKHGCSRDERQARPLRTRRSSEFFAPTRPNQRTWQNPKRAVLPNVAELVKGFESSERDLRPLKGSNLDPDATAASLNHFKRSILDQPERKENEASLIPTLSSLQKTLAQEGLPALEARLRFAWLTYMLGAQLSFVDRRNQSKAADLRRPTEWNPQTRTIQRKIHLHVGPTNSGKTYQALKRLQQAKTGLYAGPLRLLAHEVYTRLNGRGKACTLVTGDERRAPVGTDAETNLLSCTVEMVPMQVVMDVAVIDEIQMLAHEERGWAWTEALMGVQAKELHLCGEERTVPLVRKLAAAMGDTLQIHHYQRLSPLKVMSQSLHGNLNNLQAGDCVVVFSRLGLYAMKEAIERKTSKRCAIVYGGLPPETRSRQAELFNDPDSGYDFLVATDAIGMGLNLSIKRIIFESVEKGNGRGGMNTLSISEIKQIGGRAGRYRTAAQSDSAGKTADSPNVGYVTTLDRADLRIVRHAMNSEAAPIVSAGIMPPPSVVSSFSRYFPESTPLSVILLRLHKVAKLHPLFFLCALKERLPVADLIQSFKGLTTAARLLLCSAPVQLRDRGFANVMRAFARAISEQRGGGLLDFREIELEVLDAPSGPDMAYLRQLEGLHAQLILYLWLSYRFANVLRDRAMAFHARTLTEQKIDDTLVAMSMDERVRAKLRKKKQDAIIARLKKDLLAESLRSPVSGEDAEGGAEVATDSALGEETEVDSNEHVQDRSSSPPPPPPPPPAVPLAAISDEGDVRDVSHPL